MELYVLRHGDAVPESGWPGPDRSRPLTDRGKAQIRELGFLMSAQGILVDRIFSSPAARAMETAALVKSGCGWSVPVEECDDLGLSATPGKLLEFLRTLPSDGRFLLVGHEPTLGDTIRLLIGDRDGVRLSVPKGSLFRLETASPVEPGSGTLTWQLPATPGPALA